VAPDNSPAENAEAPHHEEASIEVKKAILANSLTFHEVFGFSGLVSAIALMGFGVGCLRLGLWAELLYEAVSSLNEVGSNSEATTNNAASGSMLVQIILFYVLAVYACINGIMSVIFWRQLVDGLEVIGNLGQRLCFARRM
jgi:hypothetical protein